MPMMMNVPSGTITFCLEIEAVNCELSHSKRQLQQSHIYSHKCPTDLLGSSEHSLPRPP